LPQFPSNFSEINSISIQKYYEKKLNLKTKPNNRNIDPLPTEIILYLSTNLVNTPIKQKFNEKHQIPMILHQSPKHYLHRVFDIHCEQFVELLRQRNFY
jgi:hypothetical protein